MSSDKNKLFIGNLPWKVSEEDLRPLFEQNGEVSDVKVVLDNYTGKSRGFAFVVMATPDDAQKAIENLDKTSFMGRELRVSLAEDRRQSSGPRDREPREGGYSRREGGSGGGGFGRGGDRGDHQRGGERNYASRSRG